METVIEILEDVKEEICEKYCRFAAEAEDTEVLIVRHCEDCPISRL